MDKSEIGECSSSKSYEICESPIECNENKASDNCTNDITKTLKDLDIITAIENVYPLPDIICFYLGYKDLKNMQKISEVWRTAALKEMSKRNQLSWATVNLESGVTLSPNFEYVEKLQAIAFVNCEDKQFHKKTGFWKTFYKTLIDADFYTCFFVPELCAFNDLKSPNICCTFLPTIPNVRVENFMCSAKVKRFYNPFENYVKKNEVISCALLFSERKPTRAMNHFLKSFPQSPRKLVLGGGLFSGFLNSNSNIHSSFAKDDLICLAFIENISVERQFFAASCVIPEENLFEEEVIKFKESLELRENSIIWRFCCYDKLDKNSETSVLVKHFKCSQLISVEVNGEIGVNSDEVIANQSLAALDWFYGYTTILVFVSWGKKKKINRQC